MTMTESGALSFADLRRATLALDDSTTTTTTTELEGDALPWFMPPPPPSLPSPSPAAASAASAPDLEPFRIKERDRGVALVGSRSLVLRESQRCKDPPKSGFCCYWQMFASVLHGG